MRVEDAARPVIALATVLGLSGIAAAEVPIPRISPLSTITQASLVTGAPVIEKPRAPVSFEEAVKRELTVDVSLAVAELYAARDHKPVWDEARAKTLRARLAEADGDGLNPSDYRVPFATPGVLSEAAEDVSLTEAALRYARHAYSGRLKPSRISSIMAHEPPQLNEARFLRRLANARNPLRVLESVHPQHAQYQALREKLRGALKSAKSQPIPVGKGRNLKSGVKEPRVAILRSRLGATVMRGTDPTVFDDGLAEAVKEFQRAEGLRADGIVGPRTIGIIDEGIGEDPVSALISNMERWRWLPRHLGSHHVMVNVPQYEVAIHSGGEERYRGRVIVGKSSNPTPIFSDMMEHIVVNPYWNVPYSIASKEMLAGIQRNPAGYFARRGYEAVYRGRVVNPSSLTWNATTLRKIRVRQRPGRGNALGAVKFMFPNKYAVYLHDTPTKHLFKRGQRAFSHGCVRVQNPFKFAEALLANEDLTGPGLKRMVGGGARWLRFDTHIPVHLAYFTRTVDADGKLRRHSDIYGFDRRTQRALNL
ncbi:MAG: L,D-transpeptidase family protein [Devosia sp.]